MRTLVKSTRRRQFEDRDHNYAQVNDCWREIEIMLPCRRINTILWNKPLWIYDGHPIMLLKCHGSVPPWILQNESSGTNVKSNSTAISILKLQIWDCSEGNLMISLIPQLKRTFSGFKRLFAHLDTINGLGVIQFWSRPDCWNSALSRFE
jgi:hypothetical protein